MVTIVAEPIAPSESSAPTGDFRIWCESLYEDMLTLYEEQGHYPPAENAAFIARSDEHPDSSHKVIFEVMNVVKERWDKARRHVPDCYPVQDLHPPVWESLVKGVYLPGKNEWTKGPLDDARGQIENILAQKASIREIIQSVSALCAESYGQSRSAWYVEAAKNGSHPSFAVPPRWQKNVPKIDTIAKRLQLNKVQAQAAVQTGLWFIADRKVGVYRFKEGVDVLVRGHEGMPVIVDSPELAEIVELVMDIPDSLCKNQPEMFNRMVHPVWFNREDSDEFRKWHAEALALKVEQVRVRRNERWREDDVRQAEYDRLESQYADTGVMPDDERYSDFTAAQADGLSWSEYRTLREAFTRWRADKLTVLREEALSILRESATELGVDKDSIVRSPDSGDLIAELRDIRKDKDLSQLDKWNRILRLMPMCRLLTVYTVNGADIESGEAMEIMRRIDWSTAPVVKEVDWNGDESAARKGDFQSHTGIWQRLVLSSGAVLTRNMGHADMALTWLTRPMGANKPYEHPKPLSAPRQRKVKPSDYEASGDNNDELWAARQLAAATFGAEYAATGTAPPRPLVDSDSTEHEWAALEGWWDFAHAHPWLIGGLYGGAAQVPPRVYNPMAPAIPLRYKNMQEGALNDPLTKDELDKERKGRVAVVSARLEAVNAYRKQQEAERAVEKASHERRQREREREEQTRRRMAEAEDRARRMELPYDSPLSPAWELAGWRVPRHAGMHCLTDCGFPDLNVDRQYRTPVSEDDAKYHLAMHEHNIQSMRKSISELDTLMMQQRVGGSQKFSVSGQRGDFVVGNIIGTLSRMDAVSGFDAYYGWTDSISIERVRDAADQCETQYPDVARSLREYATLFA